MKKIAVFFITIFFLFAFSGANMCAQEEEPEAQVDAVDEEGGMNFIQEKGYTPGIIFNTSNILLDLDEYQSGVGIKLRGEDASLRGLFSISYQSSNDEFDTNMGITYEKPFFSGRVSPYWGIAGKVGLNLDKDEYDADNWVNTTSITGNLSAVFGTEVFIFEFLSVFAEYNLGASVSWAKVVQSSSGTETESTTTNFSIGTELGNEASLGVVIYLEKRPIEEKEVSAEEE